MIEGNECYEKLEKLSQEEDECASRWAVVEDSREYLEG
jgi:hypothetical protein